MARRIVRAAAPAGRGGATRAAASRPSGGRGQPATFDLLIVGSGPAGAAAAIRALRLGLSAALVEEDAEASRRPSCGWTGPKGVELSQELGVEAKAAGAASFRGLRLFTWDFRKSAHVEAASLYGWLVDRARFDEALLHAAVRAGAHRLRGERVADVALLEQEARLSLHSGRVLTGRVVLIADGPDSTLAPRAGLTAAGATPDALHSAFVEFEAPRSPPRVDVVLGSHRDGRVGTIVRWGTRASAAILTTARGEKAIARLGALLAAARGAGVLEAGRDGSPAVSASPAGAALDIEAHVGKRCLLLGAAGGFVAALSNESLYPAMRSGCIAAETAARALKAPVLQDELASFAAAWRMELADYLRLPNTDLSLLPLLMGNARIAERIARAFLLGEAF